MANKTTPRPENKVGGQRKTTPRPENNIGGQGKRRKPPSVKKTRNR